MPSPWGLATNQRYETRLWVELPDGTVIQPTGKLFEVVFSTIARRLDGKIVEEYPMYDNAPFMQQIGPA